MKRGFYLWQSLFYSEILVKTAEAVAQNYSVKKLFLKNSQDSQENNCARASLLTKLQAQPVA